MSLKKRILNSLTATLAAGTMLASSATADTRSQNFESRLQLFRQGSQQELSDHVRAIDAQTRFSGYFGNNNDSRMQYVNENLIGESKCLIIFPVDNHYEIDLLEGRILNYQGINAFIADTHQNKNLNRLPSTINYHGQMIVIPENEQQFQDYFAQQKDTIIENYQRDSENLENKKIENMSRTELFDLGTYLIVNTIPNSETEYLQHQKAISSGLNETQAQLLDLAQGNNPLRYFAKMLTNNSNSERFQSTKSIISDFDSYVTNNKNKLEQQGFKIHHNLFNTIFRNPGFEEVLVDYARNRIK